MTILVELNRCWTWLLIWWCRQSFVWLDGWSCRNYFNILIWYITQHVGYKIHADWKSFIENDIFSGVTMKLNSTFNLVMWADMLACRQELIYQAFFQMLADIELKLGMWVYHYKLQIKFEFYSISLIFFMILCAMDFLQISSFPDFLF